jgi:hypothetical protein
VHLGVYAVGHQQNPTRSPMEDLFLPVCKAHGLPRPELNVTLFGHEVDALFAAEKVIVELDGWESHQDHESFESDRERDAVAAEHGYLPVRLTWARLTGRPRYEADRLLRTLKRRRKGNS